MDWDFTGIPDSDQAPGPGESLLSGGKKKKEEGWDFTDLRPDLHALYEVARQTDPDQTAEEIRTVKETGLPAEVVRGNADKIRKKFDQPDWYRLQDQYPVLEHAFSGEAFMGTAFDDLDPLIELEAAAKAAKATVAELAGHVKRTGQLFASAVGHSAQGVVRMFEGLDWAMRYPLMFLPGPFGEAEREMWETRRTDWEFLSGLFTPPKEWGARNLPERIAERAADLALGIGKIEAVKALTGLPFSALMALEGFGTGAAEEHLLPAVAGGLQGGLFGKIVENLRFIPPWIKIKALNDVNAWIAKIPWPKGILGEIPIPAQMLGGATAFALPDWFDPNATVEDKIMSTAEGAAFHLMPTVRGWVELRGRSRLAKRAPELFENLVKNLKDHYGLPDNAWIMPREIDALFQDRRELKRFLADAGIDTADYAEALALGLPVRIPTEKLVTNLSQYPQYAEIEKRLRYTPYEDSLKKTIEMVREGSEEPPELIDYDYLFQDKRSVPADQLAAFRDGLLSAGYNKTYADTVTALVGARARVWAQETGKEAADYFERVIGIPRAETYREFVRSRAEKKLDIPAGSSYDINAFRKGKIAGLKDAIGSTAGDSALQGVSGVMMRASDDPLSEKRSAPPAVTNIKFTPEPIPQAEKRPDDPDTLFATRIIDDSGTEHSRLVRTARALVTRGFGEGKEADIVYTVRDFSKFGTAEHDAEHFRAMQDVVQPSKKAADNIFTAGFGGHKLAGQPLVQLSAGCHRNGAILSAVNDGLIPRDVLGDMVSCHGACYKNFDQAAQYGGSVFASFLRRSREGLAKGDRTVARHMVSFIRKNFGMPIAQKDLLKPEKGSYSPRLKEVRLRWEKMPLEKKKKVWEALKKEYPDAYKEWVPQEIQGVRVVDPEFVRRMVWGMPLHGKGAKDKSGYLKKPGFMDIVNAPSDFIRGNQQGDWLNELVLTDKDGITSWEAYAEAMLSRWEKETGRPRSEFPKKFSVVTSGWYVDVPMETLERIASKYGKHILVQVTGPMDFSGPEAALRLLGFKKLHDAGLMPVMRLVTDEFGKGGRFLNDPESVNMVIDFILENRIAPEQVLETPLHFDSPRLAATRLTKDDIVNIERLVKAGVDPEQAERRVAAPKIEKLTRGIQELFDVPVEEAERMARKVFERNTVYYAEEGEEQVGHTQVGLTYDRLRELGVPEEKLKALKDLGYFYKFKRAGETKEGVFPNRCCTTGKCLTCNSQCSAKFLEAIERGRTAITSEILETLPPTEAATLLKEGMTRTGLLKLSGPLFQAGVPRGFTAETGEIPKGTNTRKLKSHPRYKEAKSGSIDAAAEVVRDLARADVVKERAERFGPDVIYVPVTAQEEAGRNKLAHMLATRYAAESGARVEADIVQANRVYHTGAGMMARLLAKPEFDGPVKPGARYVLVDDVVTSGGTFRALKEFIESRGGRVVGLATLTNASRRATLAHDIVLAEEIRNVIEKEIGIDPESLTQAEARYFAGFRDADSLRNRIAKERGKGSRGVRPEILQKAPPEITAEETPGSDGVLRISYRDREGKPIGTARLLGTTIGDIEVYPAYRGKGYGQAILADLKARGGRTAYAGSEAGRQALERAGATEVTPGMYRFEDVLYQSPAAEALARAHGVKYIGTAEGLHYFNYVLPDKKEATFATRQLDPAELARAIKNVETRFGIRKETPLYQQEGAPRGAVTFEADRKAVIRFFEGKDLSTAPHEIFHVFLRDVQDLAYRNDASDQVKADWQKVLDWLGAKWGEKLTREQEERFAKAGELYLAEGKAPSRELKGVFTRLRKWILSVYRTIRNLDDVKLSDEMRAVFDRMLATEAEIEAAKDFAELKPYWKDGERVMGKKAWEDYKKALARADTAAAEAIRKRREGEIRARVKKWKEEALSYSDSHQETAFVDDLIKAGGLHYESLKAEAPEVAKKAVKRFPKLFRGGSLAPADAAAAMGFSGTDEFIRALDSTRTKKELATAYVRGKLRDYDMANPGDVEVLTPEYEEVLRREAEVLARLAGRKQGPLSAARIKKIVRVRTGQQRIEKLVATDEMDALKAQLQMAARASRQAYRKGNHEGALREKERQMAIIARMRERIRISKEIAKMRKDLLVLAKRVARTKVQDKKNLVDWEYREQLRALLNRFGVGGRRTQPQVPEEIMPLAEFARRQSSEVHEEAVIPEWLLGPTAKTRVTQLTIEELRDLHRTAVWLYTVGRNKNRLLQSERKESLAEAAQEVADAVFKNLKEKPPETVLKLVEDPKTGELKEEEFPKFAEEQPAIKRKWKNYASAMVKPEFMFRLADGSKSNGIVWQYFFKPFVEAEKRSIKMWEKVGSELQAALDRFTPEERRKWATEKINLPEVPNGAMTREKMIMVALNSGNEGNRKAMIRGWGWSEEDIQKITNRLTKKEWEFVEDVWRIIDSLYPELDKTHFALTGSRLPKVEGMLIKTPYGEIEGSYFPLVFDYTVSSKAKANKEAAAEKNYFENSYRKPVTERGMTIERVGGTMPPLMRLSVIYDHLYNTIHHTTHAVAIRDVDMLLRNPVVRDAFERTLGKEHYGQLRPWLQNLARPGTEYVGAWERSIEAVRRRMTTAILGLKATVALKQFGSYTQTIDELGLKPALEGLVAFYREPRANAAMINEKSAFMRARTNAMDREIADVIRQWDPTKLKIKIGGKYIGSDELNKAFFSWIRMMDKAATYPTWLAAYRTGLERFGGNETRAVEFADTVVRTTQPSSAPKDLSAWQRGGVLQKIITPFYTFFNVFANRLWQTSSAFRNGQIGLIDAMVSYAWLVVIPALYSEWANEGFGLAAEKDDKKRLKKYIGAVPKMLVGAFPVLRDIATPVIDRAFTGRFYDPEYPIMEALKTQADAGTRIIDMIEKDRVTGKDWWKLARSVIEAGPYWAGSGLPSKQIIISLEGIGALATGDTTNPAVLFFRRKEGEKKRLQTAVDY